MQPKNLATVRVSNLPPGFLEEKLRDVLTRATHLPRASANATPNISLCPHTCKGSSQVATVTFQSQSSAKKALSLNGRVLDGRSVSIDRDFMGLTILASPKQVDLDIIAVHGLNGHAYGTWAHHEDGNPAPEAMWLRDFLPRYVKRARVLVYGYNSALLGSNASVSGVKDFAYDLLQRIVDDRAEQSRPLIFVCHSLGGIVVKQALVFAFADQQRFNCIGAATKSIIFLATPHGGSKSANIGSLLSHVASLAFHNPSKQLLETLKHGSNTLTQLSQEFREIHSSFDIVSFYERRKTPGLNSLIVDEASSKLGLDREVLIPIDATHRRICKFQSETDPLFLPLLGQIKRCSAQITQAARPESNGTTVLQHFMVPVSTNPHFVGRTKQIQLLEDYFSAQEYDTCSTYPIVAIHGLGGVGKTQLATKFVYDRRIRKPDASVFWVSARNADEITTGFQEIADKLSLVRKADGSVGYNRSSLTAGVESAAEVGIRPDGVDLLKSWMLMPGHEDWLLVLDNFDDIRVEVDGFLPVGASGSVLITTRDRKAIGSVATAGFPLTGMDHLDAERLFLRIQSVGADPDQQTPIPEPENQDLKQILGELQYFPLAIDQAASFIRENSPMTLREYLNYLKPRSVDRERLLRFKQANPTYPDSVMTTWEISLQYLERHQPRACWILQLLGFLDHSSVSEKLLTSVTKRIPWMFDVNTAGKQLPSKYRTQLAYLEDDVGFRVVIGTLVSLSLLQRNLSGPTLHVHPLVHEWIRVRLNPYPDQQAKFTIFAAIILYQYLPSEMVLWLDFQPTSVSEEHYYRINQVSRHTRAVLANLRDYAIDATSIPLECFMLCEVCFLGSLSTYSFHHFGKSTKLSKDLDRTVKLIISQPCYEQTSSEYFIHRVILCCRDNLKQMNRLASVSKMADTFESLQYKISLEKRPDDFLMLLARSVVGVCDSLDQESAEDLLDQYHQKAASRKGQRRRIRYRLFECLRSLFSSLEPLSTLLRRTDSVIKNRLLKVMAAEEFATQTWFDVKQTLSFEYLGLFGFDEKAAHMCLLARLLWEYRGPRDFLGLQNFFTTVISECSSMRIKARHSAILHRDEAGIRALSRSSYISSSFGREISKSKNNKIDTDLIIPLDYIWDITLPVAQMMSDPRQQWHGSRLGDPHIRPLDISQRRWSLNLVSSVSKIYKRIRADQGDGVGTNALFLNYFADLSVRYCLIDIYSNLRDWERLQRELVIALQFDDVLRFCNSLGSLPWEAKSETGFQRNVSPPPRSYTPQSDPQDTSWPLLIFKAARDLVTGQTAHISGVSEKLSERELGTKLQDPNVTTQNAAVDIEARLEAAVSRRLLRESTYCLTQVARLHSLGIPDSCNGIADPNVDNAIAHLFALAQKREILNDMEVNDLRLKISVVAHMSPESYTKCLGNLEIIYQLAQKLSAKYPELMYIRYASEDSSSADEFQAGSSDDEMKEEEDDAKLDTDGRRTRFDWGW